MSDFARGDRIKRLRQNRHLSQEQAAHELGVTVRTIRSWEKGRGIKWRNAKRVAKFYKVEPGTLVERELPEVNDSGAATRLDNKLDEILDRLTALEEQQDALHTRLSKSRTSGTNHRTSSGD